MRDKVTIVSFETTVVSLDVKYSEIVDVVEAGSISEISWLLDGCRHS